MAEPEIIQKTLSVAPSFKVWPLGNPAEFSEEKKYLFAEAIVAAFSTPFNVNTKRAYMEDVRAFFDVADVKRITIEQVLSVTTQKATDYRDQLKAQGLANATIQRRMIFVRKFYKYLYKKLLIPTNPLDPVFVPLPKASEDEITVTPLTDDEIQKMLLVPSQTWKGRRAYTVMIFALTFGLRRSEIARIKTQQIIRNRQTGLLEFPVATKGAKQRRCTFRPEAEEVLRRWIAIRGYYDGPLFPSSRLNPLNPIHPDQIRQLIHNIALLAGIQYKEAGVDERRKSQRWHVSPHSFRAACIYQLHRRGMPIEEIANFVGHKSPAVTWRYITRIKVQPEKYGTTFDHFILSTIDRKGGVDLEQF